MKFRKDINGLRALAVISVVLFHFNAAWMPGGFAGVDVFFVISGFLMTGIIFRGIEQQNFSILKFYVARANRIIPALALLCLVLLVFGWFYLTPMEYKALGKHAASSVSFLSNIVYWTEANYFDAASHEKWLLHSWSLSVEWQFYIIYPLILVAMRKFMSIKTMKVMLIVGTVVGFIFCALASYRWASASYYLLPTRAWEMMIGGVAYLYPWTLSEKRKKLVEWVGIISIIGSYFLVSATDPWPGYLALFPVIGSFLIIQAQRNDSFITSNIVFQKLGSWSYSIYLWHWPLVVAIYIFSMPDQYIYIGMALSILLGFLSYKYVERIKFKSNFNSLLSYFRSKPIYIAGFVGVIAGLVFIQNGVGSRFSLSATDTAIAKDLVIPYRSNGYCFYSSHDPSFVVSQSVGTNCYLGDKEKQSTTLLFGDSYAGHLEPFFDEVFKDNNASFQSIVTNWCMPSLSENYTGPKSDSAYDQCLLNRAYLKENMSNYKNIIFAGSWDGALNLGYFEDIEQVVDEAAELDINVFIMAAPHRYMKSPLQSFYRSMYFQKPFNMSNIQENDVLVTDANTRLERLSENYANVYYLDRSLLYRDTNTFNIEDYTIPYSFDGGHISVLGSKYAAKHFMNQQDYELVMSHFDLK
ncbi:acyltransferase family protein [Psychrobacter jeotgali]|uniref:acyltransferase family protein n=1 Tax=Psychrobacter jeotgali TaxID=179010 RepID=UPI001918F670|nr:acyltransferase family protein [Psychrobacter jeotgali]